VLNEVADGVWVRPSEWVWSNTTVVRTDGGWSLDALRNGTEPVDPRLEQDWLAAPHQANRTQAGRSPG
jgi:hypothetical protein